MGVRVILDEIGAPYELLETSIMKGEQRPPEQMKINPNGWIPVLLWDSGTMYECAAITIYLCDRHSESRLAPMINESTRALYLQTLVYFSNSVQNAFQLTYYPDRFANSPQRRARCATAWQPSTTGDLVGNRPADRPQGMGTG